jgi:hypothetical protein
MRQPLLTGVRWGRLLAKNARLLFLSHFARLSGTRSSHCSCAPAPKLNSPTASTQPIDSRHRQRGFVPPAEKPSATDSGMFLRRTLLRQRAGGRSAKSAILKVEIGQFLDASYPALVIARLRVDRILPILGLASGVFLWSGLGCSGNYDSSIVYVLCARSNGGTMSPGVGPKSYTLSA